MRTKEIPREILIVEKDRHSRNFMTKLLSSEHVSVTTANNEEDILAIVSQRPNFRRPDILIFDQEGFDITIKDLNTIPLVAILDPWTTKNALAALEEGAVDCIAKRFYVPELRARINNLINTICTGSTLGREVTLAEGTRINLVLSKATNHRGREVHLTRLECSLMRSYAKYLGYLIPQEETLAEVWGEEERENRDLLRVEVNRLRHKIGNDAIITAIGRGYLLDGFFSLPSPDKLLVTSGV